MKRIILAILTVGFAGAVTLVPVTANAEGALSDACSNSQVTSSSSAQSICGSKNDNATNIIKVVVEVLLYIVGVISVIMLIVGGIRYTTSAGNSSQITAAKNTIMYALIGLVVSAIAIGIVQFVLTGITTGKSS